MTTVVNIHSVTYDANLCVSPKIIESLKTHPTGFHLIDLGVVKEQYKTWVQHLPNIRPYYAVKCNPDLRILQTLANLGASFDCASEGEIKTVLDLGVTPDRIVFANPIRIKSHIDYALRNGVTTLTFDSVEELLKLDGTKASLILRICVDDSSASCRLNTKFGAALDEVPDLLQAADCHGLSVIGVSFHVGSGCKDPNAFSKAIIDASKALALGGGMSLLDIGGGFSGDPSVFGSPLGMASVITRSIQKYTPTTQVIAEPGRFMVSRCQTLVMPIIGKKTTTTQNIYYVPEGLYHSFNCLLYDHAEVSFTALKKNHSETMLGTIFGPTCDAFDCIAKGIKMPDLDVGDCLVFPNMGAYTTAAGSDFNGFPSLPRVYVE